jgi:uncharacterized membrane protein
MFTKTDIEKYFIAEKQESLLFLGIGITGIILALLFWFILKSPFYKGASVPLVLVGSLLGIVGYTVYMRSDSDRISNVYAYDMNPTELKEKELPRMQVVMKNFIIYRNTEIGLAVIGLLLFFYFRNNSIQQFWSGFGIGLFCMAILALGADYFAEKRGHVYMNGLESYVHQKHIQ